MRDGDDLGKTAQPRYPARRERIDDIDQQVLVAQEYRREGEEESAGEQELDDLEGAADRAIADGTQHHVGHRQQHHGDEEYAGGGAAGRGSEATPALQFQKFFEVFACLSERPRIAL